MLNERGDLLHAASGATITSQHTTNNKQHAIDKYSIRGVSGRQSQEHKRLQQVYRWVEEERERGGGAAPRSPKLEAGGGRGECQSMYICFVFNLTVRRFVPFPFFVFWSVPILSIRRRYTILIVIGRHSQQLIHAGYEHIRDTKRSNIYIYNHT